MIKFIKKNLNTPDTRALITRFAKFIVVGGIVFCVHSSSIWFFLRVLSLGNILSLTFGYIIAAVAHFLLNNFITFGESDALYRRRISGYLMVLISNYFISTFIGTMVLEYIIDNVLITTIIITMFTTIYSFLILNFVVYKTKRSN